MRTGRRLAAKPRSASQISPGLAFIEEIEDFLDDGPGWNQVKCIGVGHGDHVAHQLLYLRSDLRVPCRKLLVELFGELRHGGTVPPFR